VGEAGNSHHINIIDDVVLSLKTSSY